MANTKEKHVHKFRRHRYSSGNVVFFCALPDCKVKIDPALSLGKRSLCWRCGEPFILSEYAIRLAKPHCENCHKPKSIPLSTEDQLRQDWIHPPTETEKAATQELVSAVASDSVSSLKSRLASVLKRAAEEEDGEI